MNTNHEQQARCAGRTPCAAAQNTRNPLTANLAASGKLPNNNREFTKKDVLPEIQALFDIFEDGGWPNFLDIMAAISKSVALVTEDDQIPEADTLLDERMSGKKCRFCS